MRARIVPWVLSTVVLACVPLSAAIIDSNTFGGLEARSIGPAAMSGRVAALDAVAEDPLTIYVGAASGGVWKSEDAGVTFEPIFDEHTQSIGAVRIDPSNPETVWIGTGESWTRNSTSVGTGVYKSVDGGDTWEFKGLGDSERIARIRVSPSDSDTVYVCATGQLWSANEERGLYKTTDGGETWERMLYVDADTGCSDLDMDPQDPDILYVGMWQFRRAPDFFTSGGPGSGLYKTTDGGASWTELTAGLPAGEKGRIAVAVAPSRPNRVYAMVEADDTWLYRSDDTGANWEKVNASFNVTVRPFYFGHLVVDPNDHERVYKPGLSFGVSSDGGESFSGMLGPGGNIHSDLHAVWINPHNSNEILVGTDGGVYQSFDQGQRFLFLAALPISQFYEVGHDLEWPYNVYGGLQDNGSWMAPSRSAGGIFNSQWRNIGFGDGFHSLPDATDPNIVYVEYQGGQIMRFHRDTGQIKQIKPYPAAGEPDLRCSWNTAMHTPTVGSRHPLRRLSVPVQVDRPGRLLGEDLARPDDERPRPPAPEAVRRPVDRQLHGREQHDDLHRRRVAAGSRRDLGGHGRRQRPADARRRRDVERGRRQHRPVCRRGSGSPSSSRVPMTWRRPS